MGYLSAKTFINTPVPYAAAPIINGDVTRWVGLAAVQMAQTGKGEGPGFEADLLRQEVGSDPSWYLERSPATIHFGSSYKNSWDWRVYTSKSQCVAQRLTSRM